MGGRQDESMFGKVVDIRYRCSACKRGLRVFTVYFGHSPVDKDGRSELILEKVGQSPAWSIDIDQKVQKSLGEDLATYYRRGLVCESQGYGIGAFAYYRRIVEIKIDNLLEDISVLIPQEEVEKYQAALVEVKKEQQANKKIELVKELLPSSLRPDGINPLDILHSMLSEGLHAETDENCLEYAEEIRECLIYLLNEVTQKRASAAQFTDRMKKFLDKRSTKSQS